MCEAPKLAAVINNDIMVHCFRVKIIPLSTSTVNRGPVTINKIATERQRRTLLTFAMLLLRITEAEAENSHLCRERRRSDLMSMMRDDA
jgi:hypothetical protein